MSLYYFIDLFCALAFFWLGPLDFFTGLGLSLLISFSMRGYEGIVLSNKKRQKASTLGSAALVCFFLLVILLIRRSSILSVMPATVTIFFRHAILFRLGHFNFDESQLIDIEGLSLEEIRTYDRLKRLLDVLVGSLFFIIFSPLLILIGLISLITGGRQVFISQDRVGKNGLLFKMYKFRTYGTRDGRNEITILGRVLRPLRLDELPQIVNIIKGDMSLVGPRPELPSFHRLGIDNIPDYSLRLLVRPGLTGWAQINYKYTVTVEEYRIKTAYDLYYVARRSFCLDLKCLLKTPYALAVTVFERENDQ